MLYIYSISVFDFPSRNRLVVRTPRCGRGNPGSNPGYGTNLFSSKIENSDLLINP